MNKKRYLLNIWKVLILTVILLSIFMILIPYWIKGFDVYISCIPFSLGIFRYIGAVIFILAFFFCLYSIFFLTVRAGGMPIDRVKGGTPSKLVIAGPYKFVRNPQQLGSILMLLGQAVYFESISILIYTITVIVFSHIHIVFIEEKGLRGRFYTDYEYYYKSVPRWVPKIWGKLPKSRR